MIIIYAISAWLVADFLTGLVHWVEDRYGNPNTPILGKLIIIPNIEHHQKPRLLCKSTYFNRNYTTLIPAIIIATVAMFYEYYFVVLVSLFASQANEIHSWSHQKCSYPIRIMQSIGVLCSVKGHLLHHHKPYDTSFCVMSGILNPILNTIKFWQFIEYSLSLIKIRTNKDREND